MTMFPSRAAALLAAVVLSATGCAAASDASKSTTPEPSTSTKTEPTEAVVDDKPAPSEPAILTGVTRRSQMPQVTSGIVSWEVHPGPGLNAAQAKNIGVAADAFIDDHLLRPDRWQGKYYVKSGEMDAAKAKFTPKMFRVTKAHIDWFHGIQEKYGTDAEDWPKKPREQRTDRISSIGGLFVTTSLVDGGKGPIRNEMKRKVVYTSNGYIMAYIEVTGRRANNTGDTKSATAKLTFKQVDGRWLIDGVHWNLA